MSETSNVGLNLNGDFAEQARRDYEAAVKLAEGLEKLGLAGDKAKIKAPEWNTSDNVKFMEASAKFSAEKKNARISYWQAEARAAAEAHKRAAAESAAAWQSHMGKLRAASRASGGLEGADKEAFGFLNRLPSHLAAPPPAFSAFQKMIGGVEKLFGPNAAAGLVKGASGLVEAGEKYGGAIKLGGAALSAAGGIVLEAGKVIMISAAALAAAGVAVTAAAVKFGIEQTSMRERLTNSIGASGYDLTIKIAATYGLDQDEAARQVKGLLAAKFSETEIPVLVRIAAGIGEMKGDEKGKAFLEKFEQFANKGGKATEETVKGFAEAGVSADAVYAKLAKTLGITVAQAQAKVKAGMLDVNTVLAAVEGAAGDQFGGVADKLANSVPALLGRVKIAFAKLFSGFDLGPLKGALKNLAEVMEGPVGSKLFDSVSKFGSSVIKALFGPFEGDQGKKKLEAMLTGAAALINDAAAAADKMAPIIAKLVDVMAYFGEGADKDTQKIDAFKTVILGLMGPFGKIIADTYAVITVLSELIEFFDSLGDSSEEAGSNVAGSFGDGLLSGLAGIDVAGAGSAIVDQLIASVKAGLGIASPSKVAIGLIGHFGDGFVKGAENDNGAANAGSTMADKVAGGAADGLGAAGGGGARGGGGSISITNVWPPGITPEQATAVAAANAEEWRRQMRAYEREKRERAA